MFRATTTTSSGGGTYYTAWHTYSTAYSNTYSATGSTYQVRALRPLRREGRVELFRDAAMMQRRGRMLLAPSWRRRCHSSLLASRGWLSRLLAALCTRDEPLCRSGPMDTQREGAEWP